jgi:hypothetical protein
MTPTSIAIDFDGVIHRYSRGYADGTIYNVPIAGAKEAMNAFVLKGFRVVIFTTRLNQEINTDAKSQQKMILDWFDKYGFKKDQHYHEMTGSKPLAKVYIDDRGLRFTDWNSTIHQLKSILTR